MNSNFQDPIWLLIITIILLLACLCLLYLYIRERKDKHQLTTMIKDMQEQITEYRHIADNSLEIARRQSENAMYVLHRILTEREKKDIGLDPSST